ncbi:hypothetical protein SKAU_G00029460 [Synaphobranchus kaupii]|uniref:Uncharacterized protein n=1 Tax=Synaphobranchus kaupii TaxID=118154 RepID=A0A9Q1JDY3_SYNKA|nr:hypothetical protein SKAU_G00029460 [Synaphobranchus kaupii]
MRCLRDTQWYWAQINGTADTKVQEGASGGGAATSCLECVRSVAAVLCNVALVPAQQFLKTPQPSGNMLNSVLHTSR